VANGHEDALNAMIAFVRGVGPRDPLEATLATQMAATHALTMNFARRLTNATTIQQQDSAERALNKLARTFTTQMEALKRYRTGGQQKMKAVRPSSDMLSTRRRGVPTKKNEQPHAKQITHALESTMWGKDPEGERLPITSDGQRALPNSWRQIPRRSEGQSQRMEAWTLLCREPASAATAKRLRESRKAHDRRHLTCQGAKGRSVSTLF
jgi:hypothetical protein